jgi:hypothetical protein
MKKKIYTIEELEKEKESLRMTMDVTRDAFIESLGNNRKLALRFFLGNVAIPAGVLGLGTMAVKKFSDHSGDEQKSQKDKKKKFKINYQLIFKKLFPIALNLLQAFLLKKQNEKMQEYLADEFDESEEATEKSINTPLKSVS